MRDEALLRALREKPERGISLLTEQYAALVASVVRGVLAGSSCPSSDVEDCTADTLSEFYLGLDRYDPGICSVKTYLCLIARRRATDRLRRRGLTEALPEDGEIGLAGEDTTEDDAIAAETRREVFRAVRALGQPDTEIIMRKYYLGQPSREIAAAMHMSVSRVDTRAHRAVARLREMLGGGNADYKSGERKP